MKCFFILFIFYCNTDACKPPSTSLNQATASPRRSLRSTTQSNGAMNKISTNRQRDSTEVKRQQQTNIGSIKRSSSPIFTSPMRTRKGSASSKIPVVPNRRNFSIVASGLSQSELVSKLFVRSLFLLWKYSNEPFTV